jgi:DNA polymerase III alpha subunit
MANMIARAKNLGRTHFAYTDQGHLSSALKAYSMAKKEGLKPVLGLEFYFYDQSCDIISGTKAARCQYFQGTIYAKDQAAYQEIVKIVSRIDLATIEVYDDKVQLWTWAELEHLAKYNTELIVGGSVHDMVGKVFLAGEPQLSVSIFQKLKGLFRDNLSVALLCEKWDRKFSQVVEIKYRDGTADSLLATDTVSTNAARNIRSIDLVTRRHHTFIKSKKVGNTFYEVNKEVLSTKLHKGYLPLPVDASQRINKLLYSIALKLSTPVMATDYAFYCERTDKVVQELVLEGRTKLHPTLNMKSSEEISEYLAKVMGLTELEIATTLANNDAWAAKFDAFELNYLPRLAETEGTGIRQVMEIIKVGGRMKWDNPEWIARLKEELVVIEQNGVMSMTPYFLPIHDVLAFYKANGRLTGPGRGSAAGSLLAYLMGITQVNPFKFGLSFSRFYSMDRIRDKKLADIDCLSPKTLIKTNFGELSIEYLSTLDKKDYPKLLTLKDGVYVWELPLAIFNKGTQKVYEYELDDGKKIICTKDHKVLTEKGWMEIDEVFKRGMDIKIFK